MKEARKKHRFDNSVKKQVHQIQCITGRNGKKKSRGWMDAKYEVLYKPGCISDAFEFREP